MTALATSRGRLVASPFARRLARERRIALEQVRGSGPGGRVVGPDILSFAPAPVAAARIAPPRYSALAATIELARLTQLSSAIAAAGSPFELEEVLLRAAGSALEDVPGASTIPEGPIALERGHSQFVFTTIRGQSLAPLRARRLAAEADGADHSAAPAVLSLRLLPASAIRPVLMPLKPGRAMRLAVAPAPAGDTAEALLGFDAALVGENEATEFLGRFKTYLEVPLRLLA
ncbi:MAG: hypothetical protein F9K43_23685 [Bauldia sp.]|nr:MAG: hypothetical protein F9K43_23685 [Bauldia sp.]